MKNITPSRTITVFIMIIAAIIFILIVQLIPLGSGLKKIILDYPGEAYPLTIQNVMWIVFFIGLGELYGRVQLTQHFKTELSKHYLPENDQAVLTNKDLGVFFRKVRGENENGLAGLIKILIMQFQTSRSIEQTHSMLNSQMEMKSSMLDIRYSMIRYIVWLIPTLGFIGTVVGIALSLNFAGSTDPGAPTFLKDLTQKLGVAFYTTLVALLMSGILVFIMHIVQSKEEEIIVTEGKYCLDNFINRLYLKE